MALYEALYGRWCRSPVGWFESGEFRLLGTNLVQDALGNLKDWGGGLWACFATQLIECASGISCFYAPKVYLGSVSCFGFQHGSVGWWFDLWCGTGGHFGSVGSKVEVTRHSFRRGAPAEKATRETGREICRRYLYLFETPGIFLDPFENER